MKYKFVPYFELLSPEQLSKMGRHARRMYAVAWNYMNQRGRVQVTIQNTVMATRLGVSVGTVITAQVELSASGLLEVRQAATGCSITEAFVVYDFPQQQ